MTREDKAYAFVKGALIGTGVGDAAGVILKGTHNRGNGEKFFKGAGKAALIGGGTGAVIGGLSHHLSTHESREMKNVREDHEKKMGKIQEKMDKYNKDSEEHKALVSSMNAEIKSIYAKGIHMTPDDAARVRQLYDTMDSGNLGSLLKKKK